MGYCKLGTPTVDATLFDIAVSGSEVSPKDKFLLSNVPGCTLDGDPENILAPSPNKSPTLWKKEPAAPRPSCNKESTPLLNAD